MVAAQPKKRSAKEVYANLKAKNAERVIDRLNEVLNAPLAPNEITYLYTTPSGMEWTLRKPNMNLFVKAGLLPTQLAMKMSVITKETTNGLAILNKITSKELAQTIEFNSAVIRYICVNPRIVEVAENDDEIAFDDVMQVDYDDLLKWATGGGGEAERLDNFPDK